MRSKSLFSLVLLPKTEILTYFSSSPTANATRTLANFQALAAKASVNLPGSVIEGGVAGTNGTSTTSATPSTTSGAVASTGSSAAHKLGPVEGVVGLVGLVMGAFLL